MILRISHVQCKTDKMQNYSPIIPENRNMKENKRESVNKKKIFPDSKGRYCDRPKNAHNSRSFNLLYPDLVSGSKRTCS
ncbi:predicted protein [Methanosarcina acetivorans C2A]|uniref:Uncharacterized protein n=1 Tax=Methanosarcina acetivorans (strain ATCC 35395 / DSM 2834 / JCM 12185 / C2A) TaxID=188937 RepID=Q8TNT5_METAC|nr:predicted protein [Methanosarcina acetivorans C2A]